MDLLLLGGSCTLAVFIEGWPHPKLAARVHMLLVRVSARYLARFLAPPADPCLMCLGQYVMALCVCCGANAAAIHFVGFVALRRLRSCDTPAVVCCGLFEHRQLLPQLV